jgi:hypothetical protein
MEYSDMEKGKFPANPREERAEVAERKRAEKVVTSDVRTKKKSGAHKFADVFVSEDVSNVKNYIFMDVLIPAAKKLISDVVTNGIDMLLYGESGRSRKGTNASYISYNRFSERGSDRHEPSSTRAARSTYDYDNVEFDNRVDAEEVLNGLDAIIEQYGHARVADLYDLAGITKYNYTDNNYGWLNLSTAKVARVRGKYMLELPRAVPIDRR